MIVGTNKNLFIAAKAELVNPDRVCAAWGHDKIVPNDKYLYITANYVEADKPNENRHFWSFEDLEAAQTTVVNSPVNVMHQPSNVVGATIAEEMVYPTGHIEARDFSQQKREELAGTGAAMPDGSFPIVTVEDLKNAIQAFGRAKDKAAAKRHIIKRAKSLGETNLLPDSWKALENEDLELAFALNDEDRILAYSHLNPYIQTLAVIWKFYFPQTTATLEAAQEMGNLFVSMECASNSVTRVDKDGTETQFPFMGGNLKEYGFTADSDYCRLDKPHFLGTGLVIPPGKPGWRGAEVRELMKSVSDEEASEIYEQVKSMAPHLDPKKWEEMMFTLLGQGS